MKKALYFPYINVPRSDWTIRALLYYDRIGAIVPQEYYYYPEENFDPFMLELVREDLVQPINPMDVLARPSELAEPFQRYVEINRARLTNRIKTYKGHIAPGLLNPVRIHADKIDENIFIYLRDMGLAIQGEGRWYYVERWTANQLMKYLAAIIGSKLKMLPMTDKINPAYNFTLRGSQEKKRYTILKRLIPFPADIQLIKINNFKEKHSTLLAAFRNRVEQLVLDPNLHEGTELFNEKIVELELRKTELAEKMSEKGLGKIVFGSVGGIIGSFSGFADADSNITIIGSLIGFGAAIHSALQIERIRNINNESGMKYLAMIDRSVRSNRGVNHS